MKIGYFGNMNNIGFTIVRYLRDLGYDIDLLLFDDELNHFLPYCDTFDLKYQQFVRQLSWGSVGPLVKMPKEQIRHDIDVYDLTIGCGYAPAYFEKAGKKLDIFTPYGWDIWGLTKAPDIWPLPHRWKWLKPYKLQRRGISKCSVFHMSPADEMYEHQMPSDGWKAFPWSIPRNMTSIFNGKLKSEAIGGTCFAKFGSSAIS